MNAVWHGISCQVVDCINSCMVHGIWAMRTYCHTFGVSKCCLFCIPVMSDELPRPVDSATVAVVANVHRFCRFNAGFRV